MRRTLDATPCDRCRGQGRTPVVVARLGGYQTQLLRCSRCHGTGRLPAAAEREPVERLHSGECAG